MKLAHQVSDDEAADGLRRGLTPLRLVADRSCDARKLRQWLIDQGCESTILPHSIREAPADYNRVAYRSRNLTERMFCRLKDFRRIATRYDKRADTFLFAVFIAAALIWWLN